MPQILRVGGLDTVELLKARRHLLDASEVHPLQIHTLLLLTCARAALTWLRQQPAAAVEQLRRTAQHLASVWLAALSFRQTFRQTLAVRTLLCTQTSVWRKVWERGEGKPLNLILDKYKSRCVPMGNRMLKGRDYSESFAIGARIHILPWDITLVTLRRDFLAPFPSVTSQSNAVCIDDSCYLPKFGPLKINW